MTCVNAIRAAARDAASTRFGGRRHAATLRRQPVRRLGRVVRPARHRRARGVDDFGRSALL